MNAESRSECKGIVLRSSAKQRGAMSDEAARSAAFPRRSPEWGGEGVEAASRLQVRRQSRRCDREQNNPSPCPPTGISKGGPGGKSAVFPPGSIIPRHWRSIALELSAEMPIPAPPALHRFGIPHRNAHPRRNYRPSERQMGSMSMIFSSTMARSRARAKTVLRRPSSAPQGRVAPEEAAR